MRTAIAIAVAGLTACAAVPKPQELQTLEGLKGESRYAAAQKRAPALVAESDKLLAQSSREWQAKDLDDSRRDALMGAIKLNTAYALVEQDQAKARSQAAQAETARVQEEYGRVAKELATAEEQVALLKKLAGAKEELGQQQVKGQAADKLRAAELALKNADTVNASTHAQSDYQSATDLLARAGTELKAGNFPAVQLDAASCRLIETGDHPQASGLAGAGWAKHGEELTILDVQVDPVYCPNVAEMTADLREADGGRRDGRRVGSRVGGAPGERP